MTSQIITPLLLLSTSNSILIYIENHRNRDLEHLQTGLTWKENGAECNVE